MLLILDIDNTLIDTLHKSDYLEYQKKGLIRRPPDHVVDEMVVWERTNLKDFMNFLDEKIEYLGIWTNGNNFWLNFVITNILSKYISPSRFIIKYSIDKSTSHLLQERDKNGNNYQIKVFIKKLEDIFLSEMQFNKDNTLLLDDNLYNCFYNKYNSLPIKKFLIVNGEDSGLIKVMSILKNLRRCKSINNSLIKVYNGVNYEKLFT